MRGLYFIVTNLFLQRLAARSPLKSLQKFTVEELQHMLKVMRQADDDEDDDDESNNVSTIKRAPTAPIRLYENIPDTNNNTLTRSKDWSTSSAFMGAGLTNIFDQCPLEIHASISWINNDTRGKTISSNRLTRMLLEIEKYILLAAEEGIFAFNLYDIHDAMMDLVRSILCIQ